MALKFFELLEEFMVDVLLIQSTQFEKTGLNRKDFNLLGNLKIKYLFQN